MPGLWAIAVYFIVQTVDGYLIVPYVAKKTVDLAPALVLGAQLLFGALFGLMGLMLADPMVAMVKTALEQKSEDDEAEAEAEAGQRRRRAEPRPSAPPACAGGRRRAGGCVAASLPAARRCRRSRAAPGACCCCCIICCICCICRCRGHAGRDLKHLDLEHSVSVGAERRARRQLARDVRSRGGSQSR